MEIALTGARRVIIIFVTIHECIIDEAAAVLLLDSSAVVRRDNT